jgi:hypothetical protein
MGGFANFFPSRRQVQAGVWENTSLDNRQCEQTFPEAAEAS